MDAVENHHIRQEVHQRQQVLQQHYRATQRDKEKQRGRGKEEESATSWEKHHVKGSDQTVRGEGTPYWFNRATGESRWQNPDIDPETERERYRERASVCPPSCAVCAADAKTISETLQSIVKGVESHHCYGAPLQALPEHLHRCTISTPGKLDLVLTPELLVSDINVDGLAHRHGVRRGMRLLGFQNTRISLGGAHSFESQMRKLQDTPRPWLLEFAEQRASPLPETDNAVRECEALCLSMRGIAQAFVHENANEH
eukprot:COSAG03_NODE_689_length_6287_cov_27.125566_3_plen_255_part_01